MKNHQEIKRLLEGHIDRKLSMDETEDLFSHLRKVQNPEELNDFLRNHWNLKQFTNTTTDLSWRDILKDNKTRSDFERKRKKQMRSRVVWQWSVAASILFLVSIAWWNWNTNPTYLTYSTDFGETKNILLNDGTSVILNANSELTWKNDWKKDNGRYAELRGEAYFSVSHVDLKSGAVTEDLDPEERMPFQVKTSDVVIDVLGTIFNVSKRREETQVFLEEGSVQLSLLGMDLPENEKILRQSEMKRQSEAITSRTILMKPGETIQYSAETEKLHKNLADPSELTEWKDGSLVYHDIDFSEMLDHLEDIYGKKFFVKDSILLIASITSKMYF